MTDAIDIDRYDAARSDRGRGGDETTICGVRFRLV